MSDLNALNRVLTAHGYAIKKASLTPRATQKLRKDLTVQPQVAAKFAMAAGPGAFSVYTESPTRFYLPRWWANDTFGEAEAVSIPEGKLLRKELIFQGKPYDYQKDIVDKFIDSGSNGLICVPCGRGKTFMAIWTALRIGRKFLIVVDKEFLLNQWKGELEALVPGIRIGIIQGDKLQVNEDIVPTSELKTKLKEIKCKTTGTREELLERLKLAGMEAEGEPIRFDCSIAMIQTLVQREFPQGTFRDFGFTIFDECHHLGAAHFSRALLKVQTKCMLGLSATPVRDDGLTKVFEWFLGKPVYWEKTRDPDPQVIVKCIQFTSKDTNYSEVPTDYRGETVMARLLSRVVECHERNQMIAKMIMEVCNDEKRRVLVLSERIGHLNAIEGLLKDSKSGLTMGYYIGGMKEDVREAGAATARVLLASYAMASEAMNIKSLNTVIMASPRKKVEQSTGRILRIQKDKREVAPLIIDVVDSHGVYQGQWKKRAQYYRKCSYRIQIGDEDEPEKDNDAVADKCLIMDDED